MGVTMEMVATSATFCRGREQRRIFEDDEDRDNFIERFYRVAKVPGIYEGAKEVKKMIIGRDVIGKL